MKKLLAIIVALGLWVVQAQAQTVWNPASGVYILQIGSLYQGDTAGGNLYYTRFSNVPDRVKRIVYRYNGYGYFRIVSMDTIATTNGADGVINHPDGDLLIGGQGSNVYKVNKTSKSVVATRTDSTGKAGQYGIYHLMMDPSNNNLWAAGIPGYLFKFATTSVMPNHLGNGSWVPLKGDDTKICTLAWDENGQTFYTSSDYLGVGYFGTIDMTTMTTHRLYSSIKGAHGMSYDSYSKTILIFGDQHVVQIDPISKNIVADLDYSKLFASMGHTFRFDQGTTDGNGHVYVADNNGYLAFIDYTSNPNKLISQNALLQVQFLDNDLDDVAPLSGAGSELKQTQTSSGSGFSSSSVSSNSNTIISSSSSVVVSSSSSDLGSSGSGSSGSGTGGSGTSVGGGSSDSGTGGSGTSVGGGSSSSVDTTGTGGSSGSGTGGSGTSVGGGSSGSGTGGSGTSVGGGSSGSGTGGSGTSVGGGSSGSGTGGSGTSVGGGSSGSGTGGSGTSVGGGSSGSGTGGSGTSVPPWADSTWDWGGYGTSVPADSTVDNYPTADKRALADSVVLTGNKLTPVPAGTPFDSTAMVLVSGNAYFKNGSTGTALSGFGPSADSSGVRDSVPVGSVLSIGIDVNKLRAYFCGGDTTHCTVDSITVNGASGLTFINPATGGAGKDSVTIALTNANSNIWVLSDTAMSGGYVDFTANGKVLRYDGVNFYDPIPFPQAGLLYDSDGDGKKDAIEVFLDRSLPTGYSVQSVDVLYNGQDLTVPLVDSVGDTLIHLNPDGDRITVNVNGSSLATYTVKPSDVLKIQFTDGVQSYVRTMPLQEVTQGIIASAVVIRSTSGRDSLFVQYNIDISSTDIAGPNNMILFNGQSTNIDAARLPGKRLVILESTSYDITGHDSIQLSELASFQNLPYIVAEEYQRKVPVQVINRLPALVSSGTGYFDSNGDGVMDSVVFQFSDTVTPAQVAMLNFTVPWYSYRGLLIQLMPQPSDLVIDPNDPTKVYWKVRSNVQLQAGLTSLPSSIPQAEVFIDYPVFGSIFTEVRDFNMNDYMAPAITGAHLTYAQNYDTLKVTFSEPVDFGKIKRTDIFKYIHGSDTLILQPQNLLWSDDSLSVKVVISTSQANLILPGDFLVLRGTVDGVPGALVPDSTGNVHQTDTKGFLVQGGLNQLVQLSNMGSLNPARMDSLAKLGALSVEWVDQGERASDLRQQGKVGQLIELGQRFLPQLVDQSGVSADSLNPADVSIAVSTYYFDSQGQYVTDTVMVIPCNHPAFGSNCLTTDKKLFIDWNFKDSHGRYVGTGVYIANFTLYVHYQRVNIKEQSLDKIGVRRTK